MSHQTEMAMHLHGLLKAGPIPAAYLVRQLRSNWGPEFVVGEVHRFVDEASRCLLQLGDVEIGDVKSGSFVAWPAQEAEFRLVSGLMGMTSFLDDETQYVFRKRPGSGWTKVPEHWWVPPLNEALYQIVQGLGAPDGLPYSPTSESSHRSLEMVRAFISGYCRAIDAQTDILRPASL